MKKVQRGESHDAIEESDEEMDLDADSEEKLEQILKDYDYLTKKYGKYVHVKGEDGAITLESL